MPGIPKDVAIQKQLTQIHIDHWVNNVVFHPKWWLLIILLVLLWIIWWKTAVRSGLRGICLYAGLMSIIALGINEYGQELTFWEYPIDVIPIFPPLSSINLILFILIYSIVYQYFRTGRKFIAASIIASAVISFILEPVLAMIGFYHLLKWKYYLSFPLYVIASAAVWYMTNKIINIERAVKKA